MSQLQMSLRKIGYGPLAGSTAQPAIESVFTTQVIRSENLRQSVVHDTLPGSRCYVRDSTGMLWEVNHTISNVENTKKNANHGSNSTDVVP